MKKTMTVIFGFILSIYFIVLLFFYFKQENILFHPGKIAKDFKYSFPDKFEEYFYDTPSDGNINSLRFFAKESKGVVLYFHGNAGCLEDWSWLYQTFIPYGYDFEILDFRTYGKSTGPLTEANLHSDAQFVYDQLKTKYKEENIILYGRSLGTGIASKLASENKPKSLVLETPYYSISDLAQNMVPFLPVKFLLKYKFESNKYIAKVKVPTYILHGTKDEVVPYKSGEKLFELVKDKANFISFENGTHSNLATFEKYHLLMEKVLD